MEKESFSSEDPHGYIPHNYDPVLPPDSVEPAPEVELEEPKMELEVMLDEASEHPPLLGSYSP